MRHGAAALLALGKWLLGFKNFLNAYDIIVGLTNAFNLIDGLDGQAATIAALCDDTTFDCAALQRCLEVNARLVGNQLPTADLLVQVR